MGGRSLHLASDFCPLGRRVEARCSGGQGEAIPPLEEPFMLPTRNTVGERRWIFPGILCNPFGLGGAYCCTLIFARERLFFSRHLLSVFVPAGTHRPWSQRLRYADHASCFCSRFAL